MGAKKMLIIFISVTVAIVLLFFILGLMSQSGQAPGISNKLLARCPGTPNCICSEYPSDAKHFIEPISYSSQDPQELIQKLKKITTDMGGALKQQEENYLAFAFTSKIFRYVDDFEIRIDPEQQKIHLRSASRVGYGDGGVNKKRIIQFKDIFNGKEQ